jgi:carbon-monoxide dehydrogenase medium subunit
MPSAYAAPTSVEAAVQLLASNPGARLLAGGQGLLVEPSRSGITGSLLVDLRKIPQLAGIQRLQEGGVGIGAMTTLAGIAGSKLIHESYPALGEAAHRSGDAQLRNRATLGGVLAGADPEADLAAVVLALDAKINITGSQGSRRLAAGDLITGPHQTALRSDEVITSITIAALARRAGTAYEKVRHPATLNAVCGVAASVALTEDGKAAAIALGVTGAAVYPTRLSMMESRLTGTRLTSDTVAAAANSAGEGVVFRADLFASAEYRRHLAGVLAERALRRAMAQAASS